MKIDDDINQLLVGIESGSHPIEKAIGLFLESLPGYDYRLHSSPTVNKYEACLKKGPNCLLRYMHSRGISSIEQTKKEDAEQYRRVFELMSAFHLN